MPDESPKKKKSALKWLILIMVLLLVGAAAAGAWFFFLKDILMPTGGETKTSAPADPAAKSVEARGTTVSLPVFMTNLADPLGQRFIRLNIDVEVADAKAAEELSRLNARVRDSILLLLSSKTYADIATTESKLMLKSEITERLNIILGPGKVYQAFITDMVIQ